jgi:hypothetical protein
MPSLQAIVPSLSSLLGKTAAISLRKPFLVAFNDASAIVGSILANN